MVEVRRNGDRRGPAPGARGRGPGRGGRRRGRGRRAYVLHALRVEADPGAAARPRARRPRRARPRDRVGLAPCDAGADRRGSRPARQGSGDGGRARARPPGRPPAGADLPQLLRQARGDARALPRPRLATRPATGSPTIRSSEAARAAHAEAADADETELPTATDGCGVVTFALPLERMAYAYSRLESLPAGARVAAAMRAHPDLVGGPDGAGLRPDGRRPRLVRQGRRRRSPLRRRPRRASGSR